MCQLSATYLGRLVINVKQNDTFFLIFDSTYQFHCRRTNRSERVRWTCNTRNKPTPVCYRPEPPKPPGPYLQLFSLLVRGQMVWKKNSTYTWHNAAVCEQSVRSQEYFSNLSHNATQTGYENVTTFDPRTNESAQHFPSFPQRPTVNYNNRKLLTVFVGFLQHFSDQRRAGNSQLHCIGKIKFHLDDVTIMSKVLVNKSQVYTVVTVWNVGYPRIFCILGF